MLWTVPDIQQVAQATGMQHHDIAAAIAMAESGGDTNAHNTKGCDDSYGLWQINMLCNRAGCTDRSGKLTCLGPARRQQFGITSDAQLLDPKVNAKAMAIVSSNGADFTPWSTYNTGAYKQFLNQTRPDGPVDQGGATPGLGPLPNPLSGIDAVGHFFSLLSSWETWRRILLILAGAGLIVAALAVMSRKSLPPVAKTAALVAAA